MTQYRDALIMHIAATTGLDRPSATLHGALAVSLHAPRDLGVPIREAAPFPVVVGRAQASGVDPAVAVTE